MNETKVKVVRRQFDRDFKVDAVRLVIEGKQRVSDVARQVGVTPKMLSQWRRQLEQHSTPEQAFVGLGNDREAEVKQFFQPLVSVLYSPVLGTLMLALRPKPKPAGMCSLKPLASSGTS